MEKEGTRLAHRIRMSPALRKGLAATRGGWRERAEGLCYEMSKSEGRRAGGNNGSEQRGHHPSRTSEGNNTTALTHTKAGRVGGAVMEEGKARRPAGRKLSTTISSYFLT